MKAILVALMTVIHFHGGILGTQTKYKKHLVDPAAWTATYTVPSQGSVSQSWSIHSTVHLLFQFFSSYTIEMFSKEFFERFL